LESIGVFAFIGASCLVLGFVAGFFYARQGLLAPTQPKSQELIDFFKDIDVKGYSLVRIDPDSMFQVSSRGK